VTAVRTAALKDVLPKEHGTWAMLLVPWLVGIGVGRRAGAPEVLLLVAMLLAFLAQHQLATWLRRRRPGNPDPTSADRARGLGVALLALAALAGIPALARVGPPLLVLGGMAGALAGAALLPVQRRRERALPGQVLAAIALPLGAAAGHAVARGALTPVAWQLWAISALFFLGGVLYVRLKIEALPRKARLSSTSGRLAFAAPTLAMLGGVVALAAAVVAAGPLSAAVLLAFLPVAVQAIAGTLRLDRPAVLKRVGIISTAHSALFAIAVIALA
jgi:hypothetical protein